MARHLPICPPFKQLRGLLLKHEGGDRIMAKVLAAVPKHGLESVW
jgi:hypothetical protein